MQVIHSFWELEDGVNELKLEPWGGESSERGKETESHLKEGNEFFITPKIKQFQKDQDMDNAGGSVETPGQIISTSSGTALRYSPTGGK